MVKSMSKTSQVAFARELSRKYGVADDLIDWSAVIDGKLSYEENYKEFFPKLLALMPDGKRAEVQAQISKGQQIQAQIVANEGYTQYVSQEQTKTIERILNTNEGEVLRQMFSPLVEMTKLIGTGISPALVVEGPGALGKTHNVKKTLGEMEFKEDEEYIYLNTYTTPLELYKTLYNNKDKKVIVFDDVAGVFNNDKTIALMKSALWGIEGTRVVQYVSSTDKLGSIPEKFIINAGIIILSNLIPRNVHTEAVLSRCHYLRLNFSHKQKIQMLFDFAKHKEYIGLKEKERLEVMEWIDKNTNEAYDINFRTVMKCFDLYRHDKANWKNLAIALLCPDEIVQVYMEALEHSSIIKEQIAYFSERTGKSRATFFRLKYKIGSGGGRNA